MLRVSISGPAPEVHRLQGEIEEIAIEIDSVIPFVPGLAISIGSGGFIDIPILHLRGRIVAANKLEAGDTLRAATIPTMSVWDQVRGPRHCLMVRAAARGVRTSHCLGVGLVGVLIVQIFSEFLL